MADIQDILKNPIKMTALGIDDTGLHKHPITEDEARHILAYYRPDETLKQILWHSQRPLSAAALLSLKNGDTVFLKRHTHKIRTVQGLLAGHNFMIFLAQQGLPVVPPCRTYENTGTYKGQSGSSDSLVTTEKGIYELFPPLYGPPFYGQDLYRHVSSWQAYQTPAHACEAGAMLARLHRKSTGYTTPPGTDDLLVSACQLLLAEDFPKSLEQWFAKYGPLHPALDALGKNQNILAEIRTCLLPWHNILRPLLPEIQPCWGHGDWHGSNLAWAQEKPCQVFDFSMSTRTNIPFDLAVAIERSFIDWMNPDTPHSVRTQQLRAFLRGYYNIRPLTQTEYQLTKAFLPLCHVEFALAEIAWYHDIQGEPARADLVRHAYLLGHAKWFSTTEGAKLLQVLDDCAQTQAETE